MRQFLSDNGKLAGFIILNMTNGTAVGLLYMTLPLYALSLHASPAQIGMIRGASGLGLLLLVIPVGFLVDRFGPQRLFLIGNSAVITVILFLTTIKIPAFLVLLMFVEGLSRSLKFTSITAAFFQSLHRFGLEKSGWYKGSLSVGLTFLGPTLGGFLLGGADFRTVFLIAAAIMFLPGLLIFVLHKEEPPIKRESGTGNGIVGQIKDFTVLIRYPRLCRTLAAEMLCCACLSTFTTFIVVIIVKEWHLKPGVVSLLLTLEGGAFILTVFGAGRLVHSRGHRKSYLSSIVISALGLAGLTLSRGILLLLVSACLLGIGIGLINIVTSSCAGSMPGEKGKIASLFAAATGLGNSLGPLFSGIIAQFFGVKAVFIALVPLLLLLGLSVYRDEPEGVLTLQEPTSA